MIGFFFDKKIGDLNLRQAHNIIKSILTKEKINKNSVVELEDCFEVSGIDCYKVILKKLI